MVLAKKLYNIYQKVIQALFEFIPRRIQSRNNAKNEPKLYHNEYTKNFKMSPLFSPTSVYKKQQYKQNYL